MSWSRLGMLLTVCACLSLLAGLALSGAAAAPLAQGQATITAPQANSQIAGVVQIIGSASHPEFQRYELAWAADPPTDDAWVVFATIETPIENGVLATWNTTQVPDGVYALRLRVVRRDGNYNETIPPIRGIKVTNSRPIETPTSSIGPTIPPEPTTQVQAATGTPELIFQPPTSTPAPPTPTPATNNAGSADTISRLNPTSFSINLDVLGKSFCNGITYTFAFFLVWGAVLSVRRIARWILRRVLSARGAPAQTDIVDEA